MHPRRVTPQCNQHRPCFFPNHHECQRISKATIQHHSHSHVRHSRMRANHATRAPRACGSAAVAGVPRHASVLCGPCVRKAVCCSAMAPTESAAPEQEQQQQQAAPAPGPRDGAARPRGGGTSRPARRRPQPFLVRIAGKTTDVKGASGAVVKRLRTEDVVRVAAIDDGSVVKAAITLTAANNMAATNSGHMLVFQPTVITAAAADPPRLPEGSLVLYTSQIMRGEVLTSNLLRVTAATSQGPLAKAVIARLSAHSHTEVECYGTAALALAIKAIAQARKGLLVRGQDAACIITSTPLAAAAAATDSSSTGGGQEQAGAAAAADSSSSSSGGARRPALCHRLVLVECEPRNPRALLVKSTVGVSDRMQPRTATPVAAA